MATRFPAEFSEFLRTRGRGRVMFGSNYPMLDPARCLEGLDELGLSSEDRAAFLRDTAMQVFRLA